MAEGQKKSQLDSILRALRGQEEFPRGALDESLVRKFGVDRPRPQNPITEKNIDRFEEDTIHAASSAIRVLEDALAKWESVKDKPETFKPRFENYRIFLDELTEWEEGILKSRSSGEELGFDARVERLLAYARICAAHR